MRWQQKARIAIAAFVIVFAGIVFLAMRQRAMPPAPTPPARTNDPGAVVQSLGPIDSAHFDRGKLKFKVSGKAHKVYKDGRMEISAAVVTVPDRNNRAVTIAADSAEVLAPAGLTEITRAVFTGNVTLSTENGVRMSGARAEYSNATGIANVPGAVEFSRGRMRGTGVGATYDKKSDITCLLERVRIEVGPDKAGGGAADATAGSACMSRAENYIRLTSSARVVGEGRTLEADEITARLADGSDEIRALELRGASRITGSGAAAQNMSARNIDLAYAAGGRVLESARLMEDAVVELPAADQPGRRVAGRIIDMRMAPDGTTLTALNASDSVQVDLPGSGDLPAKRITSQSLAASGPPGAGLQHATFTGAVEYVESRPARGNLPAIDRHARANRLELRTRPGLGDIERADFFGAFRMIDGPSSAEAPRAQYFVSGDKLELTAANGESGGIPFVSDDRMRVSARRLQLSPSTRKLTADGDVQSTMRPKRSDPGRPPPGGKEGQQPRMPAMLKQDRPVTVVAKRLEYDGSAEATYTGQARLWQDESKIDAETIVLNDRTGNLTARTNVRTTMLLEDTDPKSKQRSKTLTTATADTLVYDDAKRLAVYTGTEQARAHMTGTQGDVTANRIDAYLDEAGDRLERAVATGRVLVKEGLRTATGERLVYTGADETYVMTGEPAEAFEQESANSCKVTLASTLTFQRAVGSIRAETSDLMTVSTKTIPSPCPAERRD